MNGREMGDLAVSTASGLVEAHPELVGAVVLIFDRETNTFQCGVWGIQPESLPDLLHMVAGELPGKAIRHVGVAGVVS
jgi:hypothetical protein